jgi:NitT/TauT family transport system ATP-binding protein
MMVSNRVAARGSGVSTPGPLVARSRVELRNVSHAFAGPAGAALPVLADVSLSIPDGQFVSLIGPSGCGKSTLLNMVAGFLAPSSGEVVYDGEPVAGINRDTGYLTQRDTLLPWRTVRSNVALPLRFRGSSKDETAKLVDEALERVGLADFKNAFPGQLSGGMRSRVMIARTLVYKPRTQLLDEPLGALDALLRMQMQEQLLQMWRWHQSTVMFVTHDIEEALALSDRVVVFSARPARVLADIPISIERPRDPRHDTTLIELYSQIWGLLQHQLDIQAAVTNSAVTT